jgi:hypothetical protein
VLLFFTGFAAGIALTAYLFIGSRASQPIDDRASISHADRWKHQHPFPPV